MDRIGVRELRQHASVYLRRVADGETIEVTDRGRPVAHLTPVPVDEWAQMIAEGKIIPVKPGSNILDESPRDYPGPPASDVLAAMREDERW